jgi:neutral ceramidase
MADYLIGTGIYDVTGPAAEVGMMGMSSIEQKTEGIESRLFSRAFIIGDQETNKRVVIVSADIWSCTIAVKSEVVNRLKKIYGAGLYTNENVLISGTHTHSGPGGYSHYALYNLAILGFDKQNFEAIVNGIFESIKRAHNNLSPGKIFINKGDIEDCGWNRSPAAYLNNPSKERDRYKYDSDKEMILLKFVKKDGSPAGCLNWYPLHPTSRGEKNRLISSDNKGYASYLMETEMGCDPLSSNTFVAAFANSNCGDISGNVKYGIPSGPLDFSRMQEFGKKQFQKAKELFSSATEEVRGSIDYRHKFVDFSNVRIEGTNNKTYAAALGVSMFAGSTEDSTSPFGIKEGITITSVLNVPFLTQQLVLPAISLLSALLDGFTYPGALNDEMKKGHGNKPIIFAHGLSKPYPLSPNVIPLQVIKIGSFSLLGIPAEITTMAGRRLREHILNKFKNSEVKYLALGAYANGYSGYITTKEEYDLQHYEGAATYFGPYTEAAFMQEFGKLADAVIRGIQVDQGPVPVDLSGKQTTLQTSVTVDTQPWPWVPFGSIKTDVKPFYKAGSTVEVEFWGAHPKNNLRTQDTFLKIQRREVNDWKTVFTDRDPGNILIWKRDFIANSVIKIIWNIPENIQPGEYRIVHYGDAKGNTGKITSYTGISGVFKVLTKSIDTTWIIFNNKLNKPFEINFYHPDDQLMWVAFENHKLNTNESFKFKLPEGWNSAKVSFSFRNERYKIKGGEEVTITENGSIRIS